MAAHRSFELTLPWLVVGLKQIDTKAFPPGPVEDLGSETCLIDTRWERAVAHAASARPSGLAEQDLLAGKSQGHLLANIIHMGSRAFGWDWEVFPIGQNVNRYEIDVARDLAVA